MTAAIIEVVARRLLGKPNAALSTKTELRYGAKGSLSIDLRKSVWNDFEEGEGDYPDNKKGPESGANAHSASSAKGLRL